MSIFKKSKSKRTTLAGVEISEKLRGILSSSTPEDEGNDSANKLYLKYTLLGISLKEIKFSRFYFSFLVYFFKIMITG